MRVAIAVAELHLPAVRSLKEKRSIVQSLIAKLHNRFRVSIAETAYHDLHQRTEIGMALIHHEGSELERMIDKIHRIIDATPGAQLVSWRPEYLEELD